MKQIFITSIATIAAISPAIAVTKCVNLNASAYCTAMADDSQSNWTATCGNVSIEGIGVCSAQFGSRGVSKSESISFNITALDNIHCWCKMTGPVVSQWVYADSRDANYCASECAKYCAKYIMEDATFRNILFSSVSEQ